MSLIIVSMCGFFLLGCAHAAPIYVYTTALYHDSDGDLVQMEDLENKGSFAGEGRALQNISEWPIPRMTRKSRENFCTMPGTLIPLEEKARFAIYYGYDSSATGAQSVEPLKLEHLAGVPRKGQLGARMIKCQKIYGGEEGDACLAPKHCLSTCAGAPSNCPAYCCVK